MRAFKSKLKTVYQGLMPTLGNSSKTRLRLDSMNHGEDDHTQIANK